MIEHHILYHSIDDMRLASRLHELGSQREDMKLSLKASLCFPSELPLRSFISRALADLHPRRDPGARRPLCAAEAGSQGGGEGAFAGAAAPS